MKISEFVGMFFSDFISEWFDITNVEQSQSQYDVYLDEKKIIPDGLQGRDIIAYGFTYASVIQDFPIRGKSVYLHIRRRKWLDRTDKTIHSRQYDLKASGTQLTEEFVAFLKGSH